MAGKPSKKTDGEKSLKNVQSELGKAKAALRIERQLTKRANAEIAEAHETQNATSEILRVIAQSPTDVQPVLDVIAENARRLCEGVLASVYRTDGQMVYEVASTDLSEEWLETARRWIGMLPCPHEPF